MAKTMLDIARTAFQNSGLLPLYPNQCPGDIPDECYDVRRALKAIPADVVDENTRLSAALEDIRSRTCVMGSDWGDSGVYKVADDALKAK